MPFLSVRLRMLMWGGNTAAAAPSRLAVAVHARQAARRPARGQPATAGGRRHGHQPVERPGVAAHGAATTLCAGTRGAQAGVVAVRTDAVLCTRAVDCYGHCQPMTAPRC